MTVATQWPKMSISRARKIRLEAGKKFLDKFTTAFENSYILRSSEPAVCWKAGGCVHYASVQEHCGPQTSYIASPLILRVQVNIYPPVALTDFHLKIGAFRYALGVGNNPVLADSPTLEVKCLPDELEALGEWLPRWIDDQFCSRSVPPKPPHQMSWLTWDDTGANRQLSFDTLDRGRWRAAEDIWTTPALNEFEPWFDQLN